MLKISPNSKLIFEEAKKLNLDVKTIPSNKHFFIISNNKKEVICHETFCISGPKNDSESVHLSKNKNITHYLWSNNGIPTPKTYCCSTKSDYEKFSKILSYPVIIKEYKGKKSINIFPNIQNELELESAAKFFNYKGFVIQEMVFGKEYRILVLKDKILGCLNMVHPNIKGDGVHSISELIDIKNKFKECKFLKNKKVTETLKKNGLNYESIPKKDELIILQNNSCLNEGGETIDCTDIINEKLKPLLFKSLNLVNLFLGGIDLICEDISKDPADQKVYFLEINSRPSLNIHHFPTHGKARNVTKEILKEIFNN